MNYTTPGVKIEEVSKLPSSVVQVSTAIPVFLGYTEKGTPETPVRISSLAEYRAEFGGPYAYKFDITAAGSVSVAQFGTSPNQVDYPAAGTFFLYEAVQLYFANGGGPCYILPVANFPAGTATAAQTVQAADFGTAQSGALAEVLTLDEPTLIAFPEAVHLSNANYQNLVQAALSIAAETGDRMVLVDTPQDLDLTDNGDLTSFRTLLGTQNLSYGAAYFPHLACTTQYQIDPDTTTFGTQTLTALQASGSAAYSDALAALESAGTLAVTLPPSALLAGVYAANDRGLGVWNAPANVSLQGVAGPSVAVTDGQQSKLNVDASTGKSVNAIRLFNGRGTVVWGARTLAGNSAEWRYVSVRRLFLTVEESIQKATEPFVFAPNNSKTWVRVRSMISAYLTGLWQDGALMGAKPEEAFFVKVGLGSTMTEADVQKGEMIVEVGIAAVRPAEFIVLKFSHLLNQ